MASDDILAPTLETLTQQKDAPSLALQEVIATMGIKDVTGELRAPGGWPGWRKLESK
jgi:hypothetical protein